MAYKPETQWFRDAVFGITPGGNAPTDRVTLSVALHAALRKSTTELCHHLHLGPHTSLEVSATLETADDEVYRSAAKALYGAGSKHFSNADPHLIEVDDDAVVSQGQFPASGAWVMAWVYVSREDAFPSKETPHDS